MFSLLYLESGGKDLGSSDLYWDSWSKLSDSQLINDQDLDGARVNLLNGKPEFY